NLIAGNVKEAGSVGAQCLAEPGRILVRERADWLVRFGRKRSQIHQRFHVWVTGGSATDHEATVRMANHHDRALLRIDKALGGGDVVRQGRERILNRDDVVAVVEQQRYQTLEATCVGKGAVHEHDRWLGGAGTRSDARLLRGRGLRSRASCAEE